MPEAQALTKTLADRERRGIGTATPERMEKTAEPFRTTEDGTQLLTSSPLERLYRCGGLGRDEERAKHRFEAGERLFAHWYHGGLVPLASRDYRKPYTGAGEGFLIMPATERQADNRDAYRAALRALRGGFAIFEDRVSRATRLIVIGHEQSGVMVEVSLADVGRMLTDRLHEAQCRAVATEWTIDGLDRLIRHWSER